MTTGRKTLAETVAALDGDLAGPPREPVKRLQVISLPLAGNTEIYLTRSRFLRAQKFVESIRAIGNRFDDEPDVSRLVDLGAGDGVFAACAALRFPYAWLDCFEKDESLHPVLKLNAQVGTRFFKEVPESVYYQDGTLERVIPTCDAMHIGLDFEISPGKDGVFGSLEDSLSKLRIVFWEWDTDERLSNAVGFLKAIGLRTMHVGMVAPGEGWIFAMRSKGESA